MSTDDRKPAWPGKVPDGAPAPITTAAQLPAWPPRAADQQAEPAEPDDLGADLFGDTPAEVATTPAEADMAAIFADPTPVVESPNTDLRADLFGDTPAEAAEADVADIFTDVEPPIPTPAPQPTLAFPPAVIETAPTQVAPAGHDDEPTSRLTPFNTPVGPREVIEASGADFASRLDALRRAQLDTQDATRTEGDLTARLLRQETLYPVVDMLLRLGSQIDTDVQQTLGAFVLSTDKELDAKQRADYEKALRPHLSRAGFNVSSPEDGQLALDLAYDELLGIGPIGPLWRDDTVTEIIVSGPNNVTVERAGRLERTPFKFRSAEALKELSRKLSQKVDDRTVSPSNPLVTSYLPGARVQFVVAPVAACGTLIVFRKFRGEGEMLTIIDLLAGGSINEEMAAFLCDIVQGRANILISGGTGAGKTTALNAVSSFIPDTQHVVCIEDVRELQLTNAHHNYLLTKEPSSLDDTVTVGLDQLLKATLRLRPDRIIVGEMRDGKGCAVMLQAANTGHDGTMTTIHANTPDDAIRRMVKLLRIAEGQPVDLATEEVTSAINVVVQVVRDGATGRRYVAAISTVRAADDGHTTPIFTGRMNRASGTPEFTRVGAIQPGDPIALKLDDAGIDYTPWTAAGV